MLSNEQKQLQQEIRTISDQFDNNRNNLIPILQAFYVEHQDITGFDMQVMADCLQIPPVEVYSLLSYYPSLKKKGNAKYNFQLCHSPCCKNSNKSISDHLQQALEISIGETTPDGLFSLNSCDCPGYCDQAPVLLLNNQVFTHVEPAKIDQIIESCQAGAKFDPDNLPKSITASLSFDKIQAFDGLEAALKDSRTDWINRLTDKPVQNRTFSEKNTFNNAIINGAEVVICNADEGEPFVFNNRFLLTSYLDSVIAGMAISAFLSGASKEILFLPGRYAYLQSYLEKKLDEFRSQKLLGAGILKKSGFDFDIIFHISPGSYTGREETSVIASLKSLPPEPNEHIETQYNLLIKPASAYAWLAYFCADQDSIPADIDNAISAAPNILSISGDCDRPGIYEFNRSQSISEILQIAGGENVEAVQIGGLSGKFILPRDFDKNLDSFGLSDMPAIIVYGSRQDILGKAKDILTFYTEESCGQCIPCRIGLPLLLDYVNSLISRKKPKSSVSEIYSLAEIIQLTSKCSLGQSAPIAFLSILDILCENEATR